MVANTTITLSKTTVGVILVLIVASAGVAGYWHDQSVRGIYGSLAQDRSQLEVQYTSQIQQLQSQTKFTLVLGSARASGTPQNIFFEDRLGQTLSSAAVYDYSQFRYTYQLYLKSGETYGVSISYSGFLSDGSCAGDPVVIIPSGTTYTQNFECRE